MKVKSELFRKACHQLLGDEAFDEDGKDIYTFDNIKEAIPRTRQDREIKEALVAERKAIDALNCWQLSEASEIKEPVLGRSIMFDAIVGGGGNDKGVFQMRCEAIWHCLKSRKFQSVLNSFDGDLPNEVHFVKQCLNESEWTGFMSTVQVSSCIFSDI